MSKRNEARAEAAFMRGDTGVDGAATEEKREAAAAEQDKAREQMLRGRAYLGREFLTWLLWRSETATSAANSVTVFQDAGVEVLFTGRCILRGITGDVTEMVARGALAPYSAQVKHSLDRGLLIHQARVRLTHGEKVYEVTLDAEFLDLRAAKLPELMAEEEDDRLLERLYLTEQLAGMVDALVHAFLAVRCKPGWGRMVVPEMKHWMKDPPKLPAREA